MNKKIMQIALAGFVFGMCLSAKQAPAQESSTQEVAMAKCSKTDKDEGSCQRKNKKMSSRAKPSSSVDAPRKSAAQKVVQGE